MSEKARNYPDDYPFRVFVKGTDQLALAYLTESEGKSNLERMNQQAEELGISARYELRPS